MFSDHLLSLAHELVDRLRAREARLATAESCTGGLVAGLVTEVPGASDVLERGFVTYSNAAKVDCLGVERDLITAHGAVSSEVALAMAAGALKASAAEIAVSVTGIAGPGGGTAGKPVGLVHIALCRKGETPRALECRFGDIGRHDVRLATVEAAVKLVLEEVGRR